MRKTEQAPEPSIEEILASIRRIIADDGGPAAGPVFDPYSADIDDSNSYFGNAPDFPTVERKPAALARPISNDALPSNGARRDDEILELTEDFMVEELAGSDDTYADNSPFQPVLPDADDADTEYFYAAEASGASAWDADPFATAEEMGESGESLEDLNAVLSSVAAEMQRLAEGHGLELSGNTPPDVKSSAAPAPAHTMANPLAAVSAAPAPVSAAPAPISAAPAPVSAAPAPAAKPLSAPAQKPVWSARHQRDTNKGRGTSAKSDAGYVSGIDSMSTSASPLMEAIATSLVTALADTSASGAAAAAPATAPAQAPAPVAATAPEAPDDDAGIIPPDDEFAPDTDGSLFDAPGTIAEPPISATATPARAEAAHEKPSPVTSATVTAAPTPIAPEPTPAAAAAPSAHTAPVALPAGMDDKVRDMLKPLIVEWLNEHLPRLVEKALHDEIAAHGSLSLRSGKSGGSHG